MCKNFLLISIKPEYAQKILDGEKTVELRKTRTRLKPGDIVLVYVSSPQQVIAGFFEVESVEIFENLPKQKNNFWDKIKNKAHIKEKDFNDYYKRASIGVAIFITKVHKFDNTAKLIKLKQKIKNFTPPQSYRYLKPKEIEILESIVKEKILVT